MLNIFPDTTKIFPVKDVRRIQLSTVRHLALAMCLVVRHTGYGKR